MEEKRISEKFYDYKKAVSRLKEALEDRTDSDLVYDAVIQRFEFTYELAWKVLKAYMSYQGTAEINSPREAFKQAFSSGLITDEENWIEMLKDRNLTAHTYNEVQAKSIYAKVKETYIMLFHKLQIKLEGEINEIRS